MRHTISTFAVAALGMSVLAACHGEHDYTPSASSTNLAAYAATAKFPTSAEPTENAKVAATVAGDGVLTIRNYSTAVLSNFNLWVNQSYVIHVDHIDANGFKTFDPALFYNAAGNNLSGQAPDTIKKVQIVTPNGDVMNVQGPQMAS